MRKLNKTITYISLAISIFLIICLTSISYKATLYSLSGIIVGLLLFTLIPRMSNFVIHIFKAKPKLLFIMVASLIFVISSLGVLLTNHSNSGLGGASGLGCRTDEIITDVVVTEYYATIKPTDFSKGKFSVSEEVKYEVRNSPCEHPSEITKSINEETMPVRTVNSLSRGLLVREIQLVPLDGSWLENDCCASGENIELVDFPKNSFYEARRVEGVITSSYLDTESVHWKQYSSRDNIVFAYIATPYHIFRNFLSPLIGVSYQSNWVLGLSSIFISFVLIPIMKPALEDYIKSKAKSIIEKKKDKTSEPVTSSLIISSKGEEKKIEIKKPK